MLRGDAEGFCDGFEIEMLLDSEEPAEELETLITLARRMCFTEKALTGSIPVKVTRVINGISQRG